MKDLFDPKRKQIEEALNSKGMGEFLRLCLEENVNLSEVRDIIVGRIAGKMVAADMNAGGQTLDITQATAYVELILQSKSK